MPLLTLGTNFVPRPPKLQSEGEVGFTWSPNKKKMIDSYFLRTGSTSKKRKLDDRETISEHRDSQTAGCMDDISNSGELSSRLSCFANISLKQSLEWKKISAENLDLDYVQLFTKTEADSLFQQAERMIKYNANSKVFLHGKWHNIPRKQTAYGDTGLRYTFSGATVSAQPWSNAGFLKDICDLISTLTGHKFNFVLVNRYKDGVDHMGEHRDDETDLEAGSAIASISLGQARDFIFRHADARGRSAKRKIEPVKLELSHGSLLMMNHPTNVYWFHSLPVRKRAFLPRINLTFRKMVVKS